MNGLTADDLLPLVSKLPHDQQVRLARLALWAAAREGADLEAYRAHPPSADEFGSEDDCLGWDGEGWDDVDAPR